MPLQQVVVDLEERDVRQRADGLNYNSADVFIDLASPSGGGNFMGLVFVLTTPIPQGSTINIATLGLVPAILDWGTLSSPIRCEDSDAAQDYPAGTDPLNDGPVERTFTTGSVTWNTSGDVTGQYTFSPSLVPIVQPVVNRPGFAGTRLGLRVEGGAPNSNIFATTFEGTPAQAALLTIDWTEPTPTGLTREYLYQERLRG